MNFQIHLIETSGYLKPFEDTIREKAEEAIQKITTKLPIDYVDIVFFDQRDDLSNYAQVDPKTGLGQFTVGSNLVYVAINAKSPTIQKELNDNTFLSTISHSLYHCLRGRSMKEYWQRPFLLEALVAEGLAGHFEFEMTHAFIPSLYHTLSPEALNIFQKKAEKEYWNEEYSYNSWFLGGDPEIPYGAGHSFGYKLVRDYLQKHPHESASTLYEKQPQEFIK